MDRLPSRLASRDDQAQAKDFVEDIIGRRQHNLARPLAYIALLAGAVSFTVLAVDVAAPEFSSQVFGPHTIPSILQGFSSVPNTRIENHSQTHEGVATFKPTKRRKARRLTKPHHVKHANHRRRSKHHEVHELVSTTATHKIAPTYYVPIPVESEPVNHIRHHHKAVSTTETGGTPPKAPVSHHKPPTKHSNGPGGTSYSPSGGTAA